MTIRSNNSLIYCKMPRWLGPAVRRQSPAARPLRHGGSWLWDVLLTDHGKETNEYEPPGVEQHAALWGDKRGLLFSLYPLPICFFLP